jgi:succinoglycan biosynthesis transport protein ExoP
MEKRRVTDEGTYLSDYYHVLMRHKWIILLLITASFGASVYYSSTAIPYYKATSQVLIDNTNPNIVAIAEVTKPDSNSLPYDRTQLKLLSNRSLARRVIKELNLKDSPEFNVEVPENSLDKIFPKKGLQDPDAGNMDARLIDRYLSKLHINLIKNSKLVNISFEGLYPEIIAKIANQHAQEYIEETFERRAATSHKATEWLQKQFIEKKRKVAQAENALQLYKEKHNIVSLEEKQNIIVQQLKALNAALTQAKTKRLGLEPLYHQTKNLAHDPDMIASIPYIIDNRLMHMLKKDYTRMQTDIARLSDKFDEKYPEMIKLVSQAKEQKKRINVETDKLLKSIGMQYSLALSEEEGLSQALEEQKTVALDLDRKATEYIRLKRVAESERNISEILRNRMKETEIMSASKASNVRITELAQVPQSLIKPGNKLIFIALLVGLGLGVSMAFLLEYLDNTVKSLDDVELYLGLPLIGALAKIKIPRVKKNTSCNIVSHIKPNSTIVETFRSIRTNIIFSSDEIPKKLILVTSKAQGEGKTFVTSNLAVMMAKTGRKTLIVDTDFHNPQLNALFNVNCEPGLSDHLVGEQDLSSIVKPTSIPNLSLITCGHIPTNPSEILVTKSMENFCKTVRDQYDVVFFDTPPLSVSDTAVMSNFSDRMLFVIKSGVHEKRLLDRAISQITRRENFILGVIMNYTNVYDRGPISHYFTPYIPYGNGGKRETTSGRGLLPQEQINEDDSRF